MGTIEQYRYAVSLNLTKDAATQCERTTQAAPCGEPYITVDYSRLIWAEKLIFSGRGPSPDGITES
jgi:hypothetical protein